MPKPGAWSAGARRSARRSTPACSRWRCWRWPCFRPAPVGGPVPRGCCFALPYAGRGGGDLELRAAGGLPVVLRPRVIGKAEAWRVERRGAAISATIYASLFTLALLALALFSAARDRLFMTLFGCATLTLLTFSAVNGHLYQVQGLRWLAGWGVQGLLALQFLLCASLPQLLLRYAGTRRVHPATARAIRSEEHTSELQSLMRISYAVFCLKKKNNINTQPAHYYK